MISTHSFSRSNSTSRPRTQFHIQSLLTNEEVRSPSGSTSYDTTIRMYNKYPLILPQRNLKLVIRINMYLGKEIIIQTIQELLVPGSQLNLMARNPKCHVILHSREVHISQAMNGILTHIPLTVAQWVHRPLVQFLPIFLVQSRLVPWPME